MSVDAAFLNIWKVLGIWTLVYLADYYLTIYSARIFRGPLTEHIRFEGSFELTPVFQKDIDALRLLSPAFLLRLLLSLPLIFLVWWLSVVVLAMPSFFNFLAGALLLREAVVLLRHLRNLALARVSKNGGLQGQLVQAHWLNLKVSAWELFNFGVFYVILAVAFWSMFFLGGAFSCWLTAWQHWRLGNKALAGTRP